MQVDGSWTVFLVGIIGGVLAELLHWWNLRTSEDLPEYARSVRYWVITAAMVLAGGVVAHFYFGESADGLTALHVGLSTPIILQKLATTLPDRRGGRTPGVVASERSPTVREFFRW